MNSVSKHLEFEGAEEDQWMDEGTGGKTVQTLKEILTARGKA